MDNGGKPAFKDYNGFPNTLCMSPNNQIVHGTQMIRFLMTVIFYQLIVEH